jgi:DNA-binding response OmpR family regulator
MPTSSSDGAKTILICEDEESLRELVRVALGPSYVYVEATDGIESLELARKFRPDLVVLDLMLPRRSGVEVLADLRNDRTMRDTPVVVITAWTHAQQAAVAAGADRFVPKPFDPDELRTVVRELLQGR